MDKFQHYYVPDEEMSLDEGMIPTKNSLSFKQYLKDKPIKWGIKTFILCDSKNGYIVNAEVYTGKRDDALAIDADLGVTGNLVVRMLEDFRDQNYCVYTDRFYTSVKLAEFLLSRGIHICGTAMTNRKLFPKELIKKNGQLKKGESELLFNGKVAAIVWQDKRPVYFVTSVYVDSADVTVPRYDPTQHRRVPVPCPKAVKYYNQYMGGTDKNDQMTKLQRCRRHYKWPRRLFMKFFMWACYNSYVLMDFYKPHIQQGHRTLTFHAFLEQLCIQLVGDFRTPEQRGRRRSNVDPDARLVNYGQHTVERSPDATGSNRCVVCQEHYRRAKVSNPGLKDKDLPKRCKTVYWCTFCRKYLCIGKPGSNCWADWHTKVAYWQ